MWIAAAGDSLLVRAVTCVTVHRGESLLGYRIDFSALFGKLKSIAETGKGERVRAKY